METKVLVVDSDPINMVLTLEIMNSMGFDAQGAQDGKDAIKKIKKAGNPADSPIQASHDPRWG